MIILGVDPGTARMGYGLVDRGKEGKLSCVDFGCLETPAGLGAPKRLQLSKEELRKIIQIYRPDIAAIEQLFFTTNAKTAISVAQARGVILETFASAGIKIYEYTPLQIKQAVTSYGKAEKVQVQKMVKFLLNLKEIPRPDDASDALAVAICAANSYANIYA